MTRAPFGYRSTHCWVMVKHPAFYTAIVIIVLRKKQWFYNINNGCYVELQHIGGLWLCQYQMISHESCLHDLFNGYRLAVKIRHDLLQPLSGQHDLQKTILCVRFPLQVEYTETYKVVPPRQFGGSFSGRYNSWTFCGVYIKQQTCVHWAAPPCTNPPAAINLPI